MDAVPEETLQDLKRFVEREVRAGFVACAEIPDAAVEVFTDEGMKEGDIRHYAVRFTARALAALQDDSQSWPPITDCDRLDAAFAELEECGVIARQNFSCCQSCGHGEASEVLRAARQDGCAVLGYTFFHQQDTEAAVDGQGLLLAYGAAEEGRAELLAVGREIETVLRSHGLDVRWDGTVDQRIHVAIDWKRRR